MPGTQPVIYYAFIIVYALLLHWMIYYSKKMWVEQLSASGVL